MPLREAQTAGLVKLLASSEFWERATDDGERELGRAVEQWALTAAHAQARARARQSPQTQSEQKEKIAYGGSKIL